MPVRNLSHPTPSPLATTLKDRLVDEWRNPKSVGQPDIILDRQAGPNGPLHVFVIWDDWKGLNQIERSEVIVDAFEEVHGKEEALLVTVAMGLTSEEAPRFNLAPLKS